MTVRPSHASVRPSSALIVALTLCARQASASGQADDVAPIPTPEQAPPQRPIESSPQPLYSKRTAAIAVGVTWSAVSLWAYFAWFDKPHLHDHVTFDLEGFGVSTYAGGADKCGHFWASHMLSRVTSDALIHGGWRPLPSSLVASGVDMMFSTFSEYKDSFNYTFEIGDLIANAGGTTLSVLMTNLPALDRLIDFRLQYWPTHEYRRSLRNGNVDGAQDYSGQSYLLAIHLDGIPHLTDSPWLWWGRYADVVLGFETRNYEPTPDDPNAIKRQTLYLGLAVNMQHVLDALFADSTGRRVGHGVLEFLSVPGTTFRYAEASRSP